MTSRAAALVGAAGVALTLVGANVFGRELNALFLRLPGVDKVLHACGSALVFVLAERALRGLVAARGRRAMVAAAAAAALAFGDEALQAMMPGRSVEPGDIAAGLAGVVIGWVAACRPAAGVAWPALAVAVLVAGATTVETHGRLREYTRALHYERQHDFARARTHYLRALEGGLRTAAAYNGLSWVTVESGGDAREAVGYARAALDLEPDNADFLDTYGWALHRAGRSVEALTFLQQAYAASPNMFCIHYHLGAAYLASGDERRAIDHFRRQLEFRGTREAGFAQQALAGLEGAQ